jgi:hypothetical protein
MAHKGTGVYQSVVLLVRHVCGTPGWTSRDVEAAL